MSADIFSALQTYTDAQAFQQAITSTPQDITDTLPGMFAALMDKALADGTELQEDEGLSVVPESVEQTITFTSNNSFVRPVIELLAGSTDAEDIPHEPEDTLTASPELPDDDAVIWPEDEPETPESELGRNVKELISKVKPYVSGKIQDVDIDDNEINDVLQQFFSEENISKLPQALREEAAHVVDELASAINHEDAKDSHPLVKVLDTLSELIAPKAQEVPQEPDDDAQDSEESAELPEDAADFSAMSTLPIVPQQAEYIDDPEPPDSPVQYSQPLQTRTSQDSTPQPESQPVVQEDPDSPQVQEDSGQEHTRSQSQSQGQSDSGTHSTPTRGRTDSTRLDSRAHEDRGDSSRPSGARRTDSDSDFAAYFEGVSLSLTSRRTSSSSRTPAVPLDLRTTQSYTQASGLREGLVNVVRFIRADGVQKARVIVDPPALGRVSVELTSGTSGVEASIKVSSEQIRQLVQDQISELRMNLSQQGVQVAEFTVDVQQDNSGSQQGQQQNNPYMNPFSGLTSDVDDETEEFRVDLEDGLLYWVA